MKKTHQNHECSITNELDNLGEAVSQIIKSWIWTFISQYVYAMYVKLWDIKYLKFRTLKVHLVNEISS